MVASTEDRRMATEVTTGSEEGGTENDREQINWSHTADHLSSMVALTLQMEEKRCVSLRGLAGTLLTCSSIISVALLTVAPPLFELFSGLGTPSLVILLLYYFLSLVALTLSILFSILSQLRFPYAALPSPERLREVIADGRPFDELEATTHEASSLTKIYDSLEKRNDTMRIFLKASVISTIVSIGVILIGGISLSVYVGLYLVSQ